MTTDMQDPPDIKTLTAKQRTKYLADGGLNCPHCGSDDLDWHRICAEGDEAHGDVTCLGCGQEWIEVYTLTDVKT